MQQATFDEAVQQNIDTFSMSPEEAVKAVVAEFKGVDLSNIIKTPRGGDLQDHKIVEETKELLAAIDSRYFIKAKEVMRRLKQLVSQERQVEVSAVVVTCFTVPALIARAEELPDVTPLYLDMLAHCLAPDESRPAFALGEEGATMLRNVLLGFPAPAGKVAQTAAQVARAAATRNEANKMHMMYQGVADVLCGHIETQPANIAAECCSALEAMFTMDDPRPIPLQIFNYVMNDAVDRAIPALLAQLKVNGRADAELAKAALSALRPVAANYQICKKLMDANGVEKVLAMFNELKLLSQLSVKRAAVVLLRQLAAGNADKQQIAESGGLELAQTLVLELSEVKLGKEVKLVEEAMGFLSEMLLNQRVAEQSGHCCTNVMLNALRDAPGITPPVAKQTIKSVSALVSHNPNLRAVLRKNDSVLEDIRERFADFYDVASAIGDLRRDN